MRRNEGRSLGSCRFVKEKSDSTVLGKRSNVDNYANDTGEFVGFSNVNRVVLGADDPSDTSTLKN